MSGLDTDLVRSVTHWGVEPVYDLTIEGEHNFIANGLLSHNTRWHQADLAGKILEEEGDRWHIIKLPMEANSADDPLGRALGEPLWPEWFNDQMRADAKRDSRVWSALYQQEPVPDTGDYFKAEWLIPVEKTPPRDSLRIYGGSDYAVTSNGGDYTVHAVLGLDADGDPWLLDIWRKQASSDVWVEAFCDLVKKWRPMAWAEETGQIKSGVGPFLEREMRERKAYTAREQFPTKGDKAVRAQSFRGLIATRGLRIPVAASWRAEVEAEMLHFPAGVHDDVCDALGLIGQLLDTMLDGPTKTKPEEKRRDDYRESRAEFDSALDPMTL
jgi:predicted phage terminase large subunit-like protein